MSVYHTSVTDMVTKCCFARKNELEIRLLYECNFVEINRNFDKFHGKANMPLIVCVFLTEDLQCGPGQEKEGRGTGEIFVP